MERRIDLDNGNSIIITEESHYCGGITTINKGYFENSKLKKTISFSMWDDFGFEGWICDDSEQLDKVEFLFSTNDPLYPYLKNLLVDDEILVIDDDATYEENMKMMSICKNNNDIVVVFENKLGDKFDLHKFNIFIKNIVTDYRSKIDNNGYDTKKRLIKFFEDIRNDLLNTELDDSYQKVYRNTKEVK